MIQFNCPTCSFAFKCQDQEAGKKFNCPKCQQRVQVPAAAMGTLMGVSQPRVAAMTPPPATSSQSAREPIANSKAIATPILIALLIVVPAAVGVAVWMITKNSDKGNAILVSPTNAVQTPVTVQPTKVEVISTRPTATRTVIAPTVPDAPPPVATVAADMSGNQIKKKCGPSVAMIETRFGTGSGFMLPDNMVVTNSHVVRGDLMEHVHCVFPDANMSKKYDAELLYEDRRRDIAVLRVKAAEVKPLQLATIETDPGTDLFVIGSPGTLPGQVSSNAIVPGMLSNRTKLDDSLDWYQTNAAINPGNSGGPLFNARGEVIGMATLGLVKKQGMNYAVPWDEIQKAINRARAVTQDKIDQATAIHDSFMIGKKMAKYLATIRVGLVKVKKAPDKNSFNDALHELQQRKEAVDNEFYQGMADEVSRITSNPTLDPKYRDEIASMWKITNEVVTSFGNKDQLTNLFRNSESYSAKMNDRVSAFLSLYGVDGID